MRTKAKPITMADETPEFKAFWEIWKPIKNTNDGRGSARDEFFRHVEEYGVNPHDIVDGARWYVRNGGNAVFKLHAKTWLNRRDYEDGCESERQYQARIQERKDNVVPMAVRPAKSKWLTEYEARQNGS